MQEPVSSTKHASRARSRLVIGRRLTGAWMPGVPLRRNAERIISNFLSMMLVRVAADKVKGMLLPDLRAPNGAEPPDEGVLGIAWEGDARKLAEHDLGVLAQTTGGLDAEGGVDVGQTLA